VNARGFGDVIPEMQRALTSLVPSIAIQAAPTLQLAKGETVLLSQKDTLVKSVTLGLGWDAIGSGNIDLDASCVLFDADNTQVDYVCFSKLKSNNNAIIHAGDNLTGEGEGDDEKVFANLNRVPANVKHMYFVISSFSGHTFDRIKNAYVRLLHTSEATKWNEGPEICRFSLSGSGSSSHTAMLMCKLQRRGDGIWAVKALGYGHTGAVVNDSKGIMMKDLTGRLKLDRKCQYKPVAAPRHRGFFSSGSAGHSGTQPGKDNKTTEVNTTTMLFGLLALLFLILILK
jgi:tellurium resistance protein TerZ